jgi:phage tail P2-like protein
MATTILPPNATAQETALELATARIAAVDNPLRSLWNPATCPEALLPYLAWSMSVDEWNDTWTLERRRAVVAAAYQVHAVKGTVGALKTALNAIDFTTVLSEWFDQNPIGNPYTFNIAIDISLRSFDLNQYNEIIRIIDAVKNVRSHLNLVTLAGSVTGSVYIGAALITGNLVTVYPEAA